MVLFVSAIVGEAIFSCGALMAQQAARGHEVGAVTITTTDFAEKNTALLAGDEAAGKVLGVRSVQWSFALTGGKEVETSEAFSSELLNRLSKFIEDNQVHTLVVSKNLTGISIQQALIQAAQTIRSSGVGIRCFSWYDQPFVALNKGTYPELAFAQRVNGLAEIGDQACNFVWPAAPGGLGDSPLALKLQAVALYEQLLESTFYTPFELTYEPGEDVKPHLSLTLGRKEWLEQLATD